MKGTDRNDVSSRSHVIIDINCTLTRGTSTKRWKIRFCDLAGSERYPKSLEVNKLVVKEMTEINLALSSIGRMMNGVQKGLDPKHLIRSSILTSVLFKESKFKMIFFGTLSNERGDIEESYRTLQFMCNLSKLKLEDANSKEEIVDPKMKINDLETEVKYLK